MAGNRIENLIDGICDFVDNCKMSPLSQSKIIVPKDQLLDMLEELKLRTPDEIKRYQKIIANRDAIIAQAEENAREIVEQATLEAQKLIEQNEIMQQAYAQANQLVQEATATANELKSQAEEDAEKIRTGALLYTNDILSVVEGLVNEAYTETKTRSESLVEALKVSLDELHHNQGEIRQQLNGDEASSDDYDEYDIPEGAFAKEAGLE